MPYIQPISDEKIEKIASEYDRKTRLSFNIFKAFFDSGMKLWNQNFFNKMDDFHFEYADRRIDLSSLSDEEKINLLAYMADAVGLDRADNYILFRKVKLIHHNKNYYYLLGAIKSCSVIEYAGENGTPKRVEFIDPIDDIPFKDRSNKPKYIKKYGNFFGN